MNGVDQSWLKRTPYDAMFLKKEGFRHAVEIRGKTVGEIEQIIGPSSPHLKLVQVAVQHLTPPENTGKMRSVITTDLYYEVWFRDADEAMMLKLAL